MDLSAQGKKQNLVYGSLSIACDSPVSTYFFSMAMAVVFLKLSVTLPHGHYFVR